MTTPVITASMLSDHKACYGQVALFGKEFPRGCPITIDTAMRAVGRGLNLRWFAETFLSVPAQNSFEADRGAAWTVLSANMAGGWGRYWSDTAHALVKAWDGGKGAKP